MRNMCYTVEVASTTPIDGKDKIQVVSFKENGYNVIASKDINVGDILMYFEVDSILPVVDVFESLRKRCYKEPLNGFLIKNMKMFGVYSNGLVMTSDELGIDPQRMTKGGIDFTDALNIRKFEPEDDASPVIEKQTGLKKFLYKHYITRWLANLLYNRKKNKSEFPSHLISKSDETNIQNIKHNFEYWKSLPSYATIKMEGQSVSIFYDKGSKLKSFIFGRNVQGNAQHELFFKETGLRDALNEFAISNKFKSIAVQGEFCAPNVQKGIYDNGTHFYVYRINVNGEKVDYNTMIKYCQEIGFETVPMFAYFETGYGKGDINFQSIDNVQELTEHIWFKIGTNPLEFVDDRQHPIDHQSYRRSEGIVVRSIDNKRFSFKVKSNAYQLNEK